MNIEGSIALVTGASSGIGEATAQRLATAGCKVYGTSRRRGQSGRRSFEMLPLDVTSDDSVEAAVEEVLRLHGCIDLLVNNAGFGVAPSGAEERSIEQAKAIFDTNFFGLVRMTRAVLRPRTRQPHSIAAQICARQRAGRRGSKRPAACSVIGHAASHPVSRGPIEERSMTFQALPINREEA